tara:strand:- start:17290 stop:17988 length:699 start_codon:yes stop_codon:yes gene_type:complete
MKVAFLVPSTTNKRDWKSITETYLWNILMKELENKTPLNCEIKLFVGYNDDDKIYSVIEERMKANAIFKNFEIEWVEFKDNKKGDVSHIWNSLGQIAIDNGYEYMKVLGDDITLPKDKAWLNAFINKLKKNNNIGFVAGYSNNNRIPTQFLIHKKHIDIFDFVYPPEIKNWGVDDAMYGLYPEKYGIWLKQYQLLNIGGEPRYEVEWSEKFVKAIIKRYKPRLNRFLQKINE